MLKTHTFRGRTKNNIKMKPSNLLFYSTEDQNVKVSVHFQNGTFWLTQKTMAALFAVNVPAISKHLKNIFETKELEENAVISILETTAADGKKYNTKYSHCG